MKDIAWNDLALFAAVARRGTLAAAATQTGVSQATLSRRMTALEAQTGRRLFCHGNAGYSPTAEGRTLLAMAERMEAAAAEVKGWHAASTGPARVRISAGTWTAIHLAQNLNAYWTDTAPWVPEFLHCNLEMDIARREIDIGIRNRRPEQPWLAGNRTSVTQFAIFARDQSVSSWIGSSDDAAATRSATWIRTHHGAEIVTTANDPRVAVAMAEAGIGRVVLPLFAARNTRLQQIGDPIPDLTSEEWLVSHHEGRFEPHIRAALDALSAFLSQPARTP
ncbi:LysR family transcriptional regulator [Actibacterium sp. 188UL27-1]|uniref:LysR family transcriptional regulator n=1 Tax=Actibacterium sp. 188UL27-1 TaxID=2786961 RepID=UPI001959B162|nr:LysR family transcriptional regulator [Actibacterium sp. 188UL27-1]MBM7070269.1 LysR family transcriptional regulator [Actibacterium sp. 188UL27-1]